MRKKGNYRFAILFAVCMIGFLCTYAQYQLSPLANEVMSRYNLTDMQYSMVFTAPMMPAIFLSLAFGIIIDRVSGKKLGIIGLAIAMLGMWFRVFCNSFIPLYMCMLTLGFAAAFANSTHPRIFNGWFSAKEASICVGVYAAISSAAMAVGTGTTALLPSMTFAFILTAILITALLVFWVIFFKDAVEMEDELHKKKNTEKIGHTLKIVLNKNIVLGGLCLMLAFGMIVTVSSYMPTILQERGMSKVAAGVVAAVVPIGQIVGNVGMPILVAKIGEVRKTLSILSLISTMCLFLVCIVNEQVILTVLLFLIGLCAGGCVPLVMSFGLRLKSIGVERMGTSGGVLATFQLFGAVVLPSYIVSPIAGGNHELILVIIAVFSIIGVILPFMITSEIEKV